MTTGQVFSIQRFSSHDGPGIRTTVFLSGCSLRCRWCHNPEGLSTTPRLQLDRRKCVGCGSCAEICPQGCHIFEGRTHTILQDACTRCGTCIEDCPAGALGFSASAKTSAQLAKEILRDKAFYQHGGGVTFSGGEPLLQPEFIAETARLAREGGVPTVAVDTAGNVPWQAFETVLPVVDYFLFDIKAASPELHRQATGCDNLRIRENLKRLDSQGKQLFIRVPVIGGINDSEAEMEKIAQITKGLTSVREIRLIPYHTFGREKYETVGLPMPELFYAPEEAQMARFRSLFPQL